MVVVVVRWSFVRVSVWYRMKSREELLHKEKEVGRRWGICSRMKAETFPSKVPTTKHTALKAFICPLSALPQRHCPKVDMPASSDHACC